MARINERHGGARSGAGRKSKAEEAGLSALLDGCISDADRKSLFRKLHKLGMKGNVAAASLLFGYIYGKPTEHKDITSAGERLPSRVIFETIDGSSSSNAQSEDK